MGITLSAPMTDKLEWLRSSIEAVLNAHGYGTFVVESRIRSKLLSADGNEARRAVMGSPVRYARVQYEGRATGEEVLAAFGGAAVVAHRFGVMVWFHYADATAEEDSSEYKFNRLVESEDDLVPGLLPWLGSMGGASVVAPEFDGEIEVSQPNEVLAYLVALDHEQHEFAHYLECSLLIA